MPALLDHLARLVDQRPVERIVEDRLLGADAPQRRARRQLGHRQQRREVDAARLPVVDCARRLEQVGPPDQLVHGAQTEAREDPAHLLGDKVEEVDDVLGRAGEALAQNRVLRGDADRTRVEMAGAHHDAASRDQRGGAEAHLVRAEDRRDHDIATRLQLAVGLDVDARAQVVEQQRLLRLGEADLPGQPAREDRGERRGAGAAIVAGDQHMVGVRLRDPCGDRADADLRDELDRDARTRVRAAQVVDQLLEILDRVDVVVGRR